MLAVSLMDFSSANLSSLLMGALAVLGGFAGGYALGILAGKGFDRLVVHRESPPGLHKVIRYTFGLIVAIIVALLVFRSGNGDGPGGGGTGPGTKPGETGTGNGPGTEPTQSTNSGAVPTKKNDPESKIQIVDAVIVKIFGGADVEASTERFFQVDNEVADGRAVMTDLAGVKARITSRVAAAKGRLVAVYEFAETANRDTTGFSILSAAKESLGVSLLSPEQYRELLVKQP